MADLGRIRSLLECQFCVGTKVEIFGIQWSQVVKGCVMSVYFITEFISNEKNDEEQCCVGTADPVPFKAEEVFASLSTGVKVFMVVLPQLLCFFRHPRLLTSCRLHGSRGFFKLCKRSRTSRVGSSRTSKHRTIPGGLGTPGGGSGPPRLR